jgi:hypothetical protein
VSFPCGLKHLRRCTGSTRWWSVDWHLCQPRYPRFVHFSWSFPVNWYIQSIHYTPQSSQSHSYLLRFSTSMSNCRLVSVPSLSIPTSGIKPPRRALASFHYRFLRLPFPNSLWCHWSTALSSEYNSPRSRHDPYTPTLLFCQSRSFLSRIGITVYDLFLFFTLLLTLHDQPCIAPRCLLAAAALSYPPSKHATSTGYIAFRLYFFGPFSSYHPVVPSFLFPFLSVSFFFSFCFHLLPAPSAISFITIHELVTKTKQQCDDFFCLLLTF